MRLGISRRHSTWKVLTFIALPLLVTGGLATGSEQKSDNRHSMPTLFEGTLTEGGAECPLIKLRSGEVFSVTGAGTSDLKVGTAIVIAGTLVTRSVCMQGQKTIKVDYIISVDGFPYEGPSREPS